MKNIFKIFVLLFISANVLPQEIVFEKYYNEFPFELRIENSGIYSIASFDVKENIFSFSSFNKPGIFDFKNGSFSVADNHLKNASDFVIDNFDNSDTENSLLKKNYFNGLTILNDKDGIIENKNGIQIIVSVPNRNQLIITSNIPGIKNNIILDFPSNLACADFIGIDKTGDLFILVEKYLNEIPLQVEREVKVISKSGELITSINLPLINYLYTLKDLQIDESGNLFQLLSYQDKVQIIKWNNSGYKKSSIINFSEQFNQNIHFNNFITTNEIETKIIFPDNINVGTSRRDALRIAETYALHKYTCAASNLAPNGTTAPDGDVVKTPPWLVVGINARTPYKWGGFSTVAQFDAGITNGKYAGDTQTDGVSSYAYGVDCSGFVSRCWQLTYHASTSYMPNITTQYASWDDLKPGDAIHIVGHVRLFINRNTNGTFRVVEAAGRNWDVSYYSYSASNLSTYTPRYYNSMETNYNSQTPVLLSAYAENQNQIKLDWKCDSTNVLGYRVYGSVDGNTWNVLLDENSCSVSHANFSITNSEKYFRISSVKNDSPNYSESYWSNILGSFTNGSEKKVLIVDGFERETGSLPGNANLFIPKYGNALLSTNNDFFSVRNSELQNGSFQLDDYDCVFWILGDESTQDETFNSAEQQLVKYYLENGGNLFVSGSEIGWDLDYKGSTADREFYNNYLKADYASDDAGSSSVVGITNSALDGCNFNIGQTYEEDYPDEISAFGGSSSCLKYSNNKIAGIQYSGYFNGSLNLSHLIHLSFPIETTANDEAFNLVISKSIDFFTSTHVNVDDEFAPIKSFSLGQNFPNPFNPTTKIKWQSPLTGNQTIKVYDVLGNEVATLVNEYKPAGTYEFNFDASNLSSGVYFYTLQVSDFIQTKKMLLIK
jgi:hypothetical protein